MVGSLSCCDILLLPRSIPVRPRVHGLSRNDGKLLLWLLDGEDKWVWTLEPLPHRECGSRRQSRGLRRSELRLWESRSDRIKARQGSVQDSVVEGQSHPFAEGRDASAGRAEAAARSCPGRK